MYNKIFISYAAEDFKYAEKLHEFLQGNSFSPWMDKKSLLPGQNWDFQIQQELRKADFIILLLSSTSIGKRGYVQKEFKQAVIYCEEKLESDIYIIPVKLDACVVPASLSKFQWVEYSSADSLSKIVNAVNHQRTKIIKEEEAKKIKTVGLETEEHKVEGEYGEKNPKQTYEISFTLFKDEKNESQKEINILIRKEVVDSLMGVRHNYFNNLIDFNLEDHLMNSDSTHYENISFRLLTKYFVSYTSFVSAYYTGAAHGNYGTRGHNYYTNPLRHFSLEEMFHDFDSAIKIFRYVVDEKLMDKARKEFEAKTKSDFYLQELKAEKKNFSNYYFKENALVFIYNPYQLTAFAYGDHHPEITFDELIKLFPKETKFINFIENVRKISL